MDELSSQVSFAKSDTASTERPVYTLPSEEDPLVVALLRDIERAKMRRRGMKCAHLLHVDPVFFAALQTECLALTAEATRVALDDKAHVQNWINHYGVTVQTRVDKMVAKQTLDTALFPHLHRFTRAFPNAIEMRINGLAPHSGIPHHEESLFLFHEQERKLYIQARFHLPLQTNAGAEIQLAGEIFHFAAGEIYFFNQGAVHAARNLGQTIRYHLVWDLVLTAEAYAEMFDPVGPTLPFLTRAPLNARLVTPKKRYWVGKYAVNGKDNRPYERSGLARFRVPPHWFRNAYVAWVGRHALQVALAQPGWLDNSSLKKQRRQAGLRRAIEHKLKSGAEDK